MPAALLEDGLGRRFGIKKFFDSVPHDLTLKAVAHHTDQAWVLLYVKRWLQHRSNGRMVAWSPEIAEPHKVRRSHRFWRTSSCTTRSIGGWRRSFRRYLSSDTVTMSWCTAAASGKLAWSGTPSPADWRTSDWNYIQTRPTSSTARTTPAEVTTSTRRSRSWATHFTPAWPKAHEVGYFVGFLPAVSRDAVIAMGREMRSWHISRRADLGINALAQMINSIVQGWINYYGRFYSPCCILSCSASTNTWCAGPPGNTNGSTAGPDERGNYSLE